MMARSADAAHYHPDDVPCGGFDAQPELVLAVGRVAADGHFRSSKWPEKITSRTTGLKNSRSSNSPACRGEGARHLAQ
jgi:hypothetical protein